MALYGLDVSRWQVKTPNLKGLSFLFARSSIGTQTDEMFATHAKNARAAGLVLGAYHFNWNTVDIGKQVAAFIDSARGAELYAIDVEGTNAFSHAQTADFIARMHKAGKKCGLYHSDSGFFNAGQDFDWVARWSPHAPTRHWDFWQNTGGPIDHDVFHGTLAQLHALAGLPPAPDTSIVGDPIMAQLAITDMTPKMVATAAPTTFYHLDGSVDSTGHAALAPRLSPFGVAGFRAIYAGPAPVILVLVKPSSVTDLPASDAAVIKTAHDAANAAVIAQKAAEAATAAAKAQLNDWLSYRSAALKVGL